MHRYTGPFACILYTYEAPDAGYESVHLLRPGPVPEGFVIERLPASSSQSDIFEETTLSTHRVTMSLCFQESLSFWSDTC